MICLIVEDEQEKQKIIKLVKNESLKTGNLFESIIKMMLKKNLNEKELGEDSKNFDIYFIEKVTTKMIERLSFETIKKDSQYIQISLINKIVSEEFMKDENTKAAKLGIITISLLNKIMKNSGILKESSQSNSQYEFFHLSLKEFLSSSLISKQLSLEFKKEELKEKQEKEEQKLKVNEQEENIEELINKNIEKWITLTIIAPLTCFHLQQNPEKLLFILNLFFKNNNLSTK